MTTEEFREIIVNSQCAYKFLGAKKGYWIDADGKEFPISDMSKKYKDNCIGYLNKQKESIERGFFLQGANYSKADYKELVRLGCEARLQKIQELST